MVCTHHRREKQLTAINIIFNINMNITQGAPWGGDDDSGACVCVCWPYELAPETL